MEGTPKTETMNGGEVPVGASERGSGHIETPRVEFLRNELQQMLNDMEKYDQLDVSHFKVFGELDPRPTTSEYQAIIAREQLHLIALGRLERKYPDNKELLGRIVAWKKLAELRMKQSEVFAALAVLGEEELGDTFESIFPGTHATVHQGETDFKKIQEERIIH